MSTARARHYSAKGDEDYVKGNYGGYIINKASALASQTVGRTAQAIGNLLGFDASTVDDYFKGGVATGNGSPMVVRASNVTPIQDGTVKFAKSDPKDSAIFAKTGGPFDKLFDDIFGKVNALYDMSVRYGSTSTTNNRYGGDMTNTTVDLDPFGALYNSWREPHTHAHRMRAISLSRIRPQTIDALSRIASGERFGQVNPRTGETEFNMVENMQMAQIAKMQGRSIDDVRNDVVKRVYVEPTLDRKQYESVMPNTASFNEFIASQGNGSNIQQDQRYNKPIDVHIYGDLNLRSPSGETINLTNMIQNDPMLIRKLTELIICQVGKNIHGGREEPYRNRFAYV